MKKKRNRILIAIHSLKVGGMERVASELANVFEDCKDLEVHIVLFGIKRTIFYTLNPNIIVHKPPFEFDNNSRVFSTVKTLFFLRKKIKKIQPDSVLSFGEYWNNLVLLAMLGTNIPVFIADRSTPLKNLGKVQNLLRRYLYPTAKALIVQTEKAAEIYKRKFSSLPIKTIGNPIAIVDKPIESYRENSILTVGRLIETKHFDRLIRIFSQLEQLNWKLIIVGSNAKQQNTQERLERLIRELKLQKRVILAGNQKDVMSFYIKSKIFAFTSSSEGFPNVIGEAMSAGLPVVSYDCMAGPSEIIADEEDGFLVPLFDDETFKGKLEYLMKNENRREKMGSMAQKNIERFKSDAIAAQFLNVILN